MKIRANPPQSASSVHLFFGKKNGRLSVFVRVRQIFWGKTAVLGHRRIQRKSVGSAESLNNTPVMKGTYWSAYSATLTNLLAIPPFSHILCYNDAKEEHLSYGAKENHDDQEGKRPFIQQSSASRSPFQNAGRHIKRQQHQPFIRAKNGRSSPRLHPQRPAKSPHLWHRHHPAHFCFSAQPSFPQPRAANGRFIHPDVAAVWLGRFCYAYYHRYHRAISGAVGHGAAA